MKIHIGIAYHNRLNKLIRLLKSINNSKVKEIEILTYVICDNEKDFVECIKNDLNFKVFYYPEAPYVVKKWNSFYKETYDINSIGWLNLVDDVELDENCIQLAVNNLLSNYPDSDGVIGINQICPNHPEYTFQPSGQILIGRKFLERYKEVEYQVCAKEYLQWRQDLETYEYSNTLGKFILGTNALIKHYHPSFIKKELDNTHFLIRGDIINKDRKIYNERQKRGLIWGQNFQTIEEYDAQRSL